MARRKHRKSFPCSHQGFGQYCRSCALSPGEKSRHQAKQQQQRQRQQQWRETFRHDEIDLTRLPKHIVKKARKTILQLHQGKHYSHLKGRRLRHRPTIVRFSLGRNYRLLGRLSGETVTPYAAMSHEAYNKFISSNRR